MDAMGLFVHDLSRSLVGIRNTYLVATSWIISWSVSWLREQVRHGSPTPLAVCFFLGGTFQNVMYMGICFMNLFQLSCIGLCWHVQLGNRWDGEVFFGAALFWCIWAWFFTDTHVQSSEEVHIHRYISRWLVVSKIFYVHPYLGKWSNLTNIFSKGLVQPPGSTSCWQLTVLFLWDFSKWTNQCVGLVSFNGIAASPKATEHIHIYIYLSINVWHHWER